MSRQFEVVANEASYWWRTNAVSGALLHRLMLLFIAVPLALVWKGYYVASFVVFGFMVPYGLFLRHLATRAVLVLIEKHPETFAEFEEAGVISLLDQAGQDAF
jgi:hypothetical protein